MIMLLSSRQGTAHVMMGILVLLIIAGRIVYMASLLQQRVNAMDWHPLTLSVSHAVSI